jgi:hypothetical protein
MAIPLERQFTSAMLDIYQTTIRETKYRPHRFLQMVSDQGGLATAQQLLQAPAVSDGFTRLYEEHRLDLTVEALILRPEWQSLFTEAERARALQRLRQYNYEPPIAPVPMSEVGPGEFPHLLRIVDDLNRRASRYKIGRLQQIRKDLKPGSKSSGHTIFDPDTEWVVENRYAYHYGGRHEIQFNVGFEGSSESRIFRHGLAFSFERSQWVHDAVEALLPRVARFNEFVRINPHLLSNLEMWYYKNDELREIGPVTEITSDLVEDGNFIMVGKRTVIPPLDLDEILNDLDRLLPLYRYVQSSGTEFPSLDNSISGLYFIPGHTLNL